MESQWPSIRRSLFEMSGEKSDSNTKCFIGHAGLGGFDHEYLSGQFKRAADLMIAAKMNDFDPYHPDGLFFPVGYLYRHSLELKLKGLLDKIIMLELVTANEEVMYLFEKHNVVKIWDAIKPSLIKQWPKADRNPWNNTEALIRDFHKIDKTGQGLRYATVKGESRDARKDMPDIVRLDMLRDGYEEIFNLLDGCCMHFDHMLVIKNEMESEYR